MMDGLTTREFIDVVSALGLVAQKSFCGTTPYL